MINVPHNVPLMSQIMHPTQTVPVQTSHNSFLPFEQQPHGITQQLQTNPIFPTNPQDPFKSPFYLHQSDLFTANQYIPNLTNPRMVPPNFQSFNAQSSPQTQPNYGPLLQHLIEQIRGQANNTQPIFILPATCQQSTNNHQQAGHGGGPQTTGQSTAPPFNYPMPIQCQPTFYPYPIPVPVYEPLVGQTRNREVTKGCSCCHARHDSLGSKDHPLSCCCNLMEQEEHRCTATNNDTICSRRNCPAAVSLQALASQFLSLPGIVSCAATRLILRKVPGSNITNTMEDTMDKALKAISMLTKEQLLAESRNAQQVNALINLHMTTNPPASIVPLLTLLQLKVNVLKAQIECLINKKVMECQGYGVEVENSGPIDATVFTMKTNEELRQLLAALRQKECDERVNVNFSPYHSQRVIAESRLNNVQAKIRQVEMEFDRRRCVSLPVPSLTSRVIQQFAGSSCTFGFAQTQLFEPYAQESPDPFAASLRNPKRLYLKPHVQEPTRLRPRDQCKATDTSENDSSACKDSPTLSRDIGTGDSSVNCTNERSIGPQSSEDTCSCVSTSSEDSVGGDKKKLRPKIARAERTSIDSMASLKEAPSKMNLHSRLTQTGRRCKCKFVKKLTFFDQDSELRDIRESDEELDDSSATNGTEDHWSAGELKIIKSEADGASINEETQMVTTYEPQTPCVQVDEFDPARVKLEPRSNETSGTLEQVAAAIKTETRLEGTRASRNDDFVEKQQQTGCCEPIPSIKVEEFDSAQVNVEGESVGRVKTSEDMVSSIKTVAGLGETDDTKVKRKKKDHGKAPRLKAFKDKLPHFPRGKNVVKKQEETVHDEQIPTITVEQFDPERETTKTECFRGLRIPDSVTHSIRVEEPEEELAKFETTACIQLQSTTMKTELCLEPDQKVATARLSGARYRTHKRIHLGEKSTKLKQVDVKDVKVQEVEGERTRKAEKTSEHQSRVEETGPQEAKASLYVDTEPKTKRFKTQLHIELKPRAGTKNTEADEQSTVKDTVESRPMEGTETSGTRTTEEKPTSDAQKSFLGVTLRPTKRVVPKQPPIPEGGHDWGRNEIDYIVSKKADTVAGQTADENRSSEIQNSYLGIKLKKREVAKQQATGETDETSSQHGNKQIVSMMTRMTYEKDLDDFDNCTDIQERLDEETKDQNVETGSLAASHSETHGLQLTTDTDNETRTNSDKMFPEICRASDNKLVNNVRFPPLKHASRTTTNGPADGTLSRTKIELDFSKTVRDGSTAYQPVADPEDNIVSTIFSSIETRLTSFGTLLTNIPNLQHIVSSLCHDKSVHENGDVSTSNGEIICDTKSNNKRISRKDNRILLPWNGSVRDDDGTSAESRLSVTGVFRHVHEIKRSILVDRETRNYSLIEGAVSDRLRELSGNGYPGPCRTRRTLVIRSRLKNPNDPVDETERPITVCKQPQETTPTQYQPKASKHVCFPTDINNGNDLSKNSDGKMTNEHGSTLSIDRSSPEKQVIDDNTYTNE